MLWLIVLHFWVETFSEMWDDSIKSVYSLTWDWGATISKTAPWSKLIEVKKYGRGNLFCCNYMIMIIIGNRKVLCLFKQLFILAIVLFLLKLFVERPIFFRSVIWKLVFFLNDIVKDVWSLKLRSFRYFQLIVFPKHCKGHFQRFECIPWSPFVL